MLGVTCDPPGKAVVGQKTTTLVKVGRRKITLRSETVKLEPMKTIATKNQEDKLFKTFEQVITIQQGQSGVKVTIAFDYDFAIGLVGKILNTVVVQRALRDNLRAYAAHLKEFAELQPLV